MKETYLIDLNLVYYDMTGKADIKGYYGAVRHELLKINGADGKDGWRKMGGGSFFLSVYIPSFYRPFCVFY